MFAGAGGKGKSLLMQGICTSLATGTEYITPVETPLRCLVWSCEDDESEILRRQLRINEHLGTAPSDLESLYIVPRCGQDNVLYAASAFGRSGPTSLLEELEEQVNDLKADILVLDNVAQVFGGVSADAHQVTSFVNSVVGLCRGRPFAPIFVGHVARTIGSEYSGSAAWENAVRMRWYLGDTRPSDNQDETDAFDDGSLYFSRRKANYSPLGCITLKLLDGMLVREGSAAIRAAREKRHAEFDDLAVELIAELAKRNVPATENNRSPYYLPKVAVAQSLLKVEAEKDLARALDRVLKSGRAVLGVVGKKSNGTALQGPIIPRPLDRRP